ncbi:MAG TPA: hypothetical protein VIY72_15615 [Acidimicrobiales bacterium]
MGTGTGHPAIEAVDRRFKERRDQVPVLAQRAEAEGVTEVGCLEDLIPLLFPHTVYKSYPVQLIDNGRWPQMNRWLDSVSAHRVDVDVEGATDVDDWMGKLAAAGHYVSASSGTTGKSSFLPKSIVDLDETVRNHVAELNDAGVAQDASYNVVGLAPDVGNIMSAHMGPEMEKFAKLDQIAKFPSQPRSEGHQAYMTRMVRLRRALAEGTATPDEIAGLEAEQARRSAESAELLGYYADQVIARKDERMLFGTMMALAWRFVEALRERGATDDTLTGDNAMFMAGGTKGAVLPDDAEAQIKAMLNISDERFVQHYSMQEINLALPKCSEGRYHTREGLVLVVLDEGGDNLVPVSPDGVLDGRAAFFDTSVDGRWGGIISGDHIHALLHCPCGLAGIAVDPKIERYSSTADGDKITCAGTMDAYVRGIAGD